MIYNTKGEIEILDKDGCVLARTSISGEDFKFSDSRYRNCRSIIIPVKTNGFPVCVAYIRNDYIEENKFNWKSKSEEVKKGDSLVFLPGDLTFES